MLNKTLGLLALALALTPEPCLADLEMDPALAGLVQRANGGGKPPRTDVAFSAPQALATYGVLGTGEVIAKMEAEADGVAFGGRAGLDGKLRQLESASNSADVTAAEGSFGSHGLGWACRRATELGPEVTKIGNSFVKLANDFATEARKIPVGRDDSAAQLDGLQQRLMEGIRAWKKQPEAQTIEKDAAEVAAFLNARYGTATTFETLVGEARAELEMFRANAKALDRMEDSLVPLVDPYVEAKAQLQRELQALRLEFPTDKQVRDDLLTRLASSHKPKATSGGWRSVITSTVPLRLKEADEAQSKIDKLSSALGKEQQACVPDPRASFGAAYEGAQQWIQTAFDTIQGVYSARRAEIERIDKEAAETIAREETTAKEVGERVKAAEERYDAMDKNSPDRPALYEKIVKARKIGADAAQAAIDIRLSRQGLQNETQALERQSTVVTGELRGSVSFTASWSIKK